MQNSNPLRPSKTTARHKTSGVAPDANRSEGASARSTSAGHGRQRPRRAADRGPEPPKTAKGERRRQELIDATARALNVHGFRDLSIAQIVAEARAPVGLFYRYFRNKTDASLEALDQLVEGFRRALPSPDTDATFFDQLLTSHDSVLRLFSERQGLLGCYYSYDYGEPAFARFFHDQTVRFDLDTAAAAIAAAGARDVSRRDVAALAHALTCMIDNFAFRYSTGRDDTPTLERSANVSVAWLTAMLRYRGFTCANPAGHSGLPVFVSEPRARDARRRRVEARAPRLAWVTVTLNKRSPKRVDSVQTYASLKQVARELLNRLSYDDMRIADIEHAGHTTRGSIYHYFGEKRGLVLELLRERLDLIQERLMEHERKLIDAPNAENDAFSDLAAIIGTFVTEYAENPGILRAIYQLEDRDAKIAGFLHGYRRCWVGIVADVLAWHTAGLGQPRPMLELIGYALLAMVDRFVYDLYVSPFPELENEFADPSQVTAFLATVWYRALFLRNPPQTVPRPFAVLAALDMSATPLSPRPPKGRAARGSA